MNGKRNADKADTIVGLTLLHLHGSAFTIEDTSLYEEGHRVCREALMLLLSVKEHTNLESIQNRSRKWRFYVEFKRNGDPT